jgi:hypothetical protein
MAITATRNKDAGVHRHSEREARSRSEMWTNTAVEQANLPVAIDDDLNRLTGIAITHGVLNQIAQRDAK